MDKKRPASTSEHGAQPPTKHPRTDSPPQQRSDPPPPSSAPAVDHDEGNGPVVVFQRAQLTAKITDLNRQLLGQRKNVAELQKYVALLDAAPKAALYHMQGVREDLTLTLARLGWTGDADPKDCPIAATLLDADVVTNDSLGEIPNSLKSLTAQIIGALEAKGGAGSRDDALAELHRRLREVSDQCERYSERDKKNLVESSTLRDEYDDLKHEFAQQRTKIAKLDLALREKHEQMTSLIAKHEEEKAEEEKAAKKVNNGSRDASDPNGNKQGGTANGDVSMADVILAKEIDEKRLEELKASHEDRKRLIAENESLRSEISKRDAGVIPIKTILNSALYQTMEANLQQLYLKERTWQMEKEKLAEDREAERNDAEERLSAAQAANQKSIDDLKKQVDEYRRIADAAKIEKDKVVMTYEARKMEAGNAHVVTTALQNRMKISEEMRKKLSTSNENLQREVDKFRERVNALEAKLNSGTVVSTNDRIKQLESDLEDERKKSLDIFNEVDSITNLFSDLETENGRLNKALSEKEQILSRVMAERLRGRQLLTTVREENRALIQGRDIDNDRIKQLTNAVNSSKRTTHEASNSLNKAQEEVRTLSQTLEKRRRIADDATVQARTAMAEKDEMKRERDAYRAKSEQAAIDYAEDQFQSKRLQEKLTECQRKLEDVESRHRELENGMDGDSIRDQMISQYKKKLYCSVVTTKPKEVVLLRCGHLFSRQCTDDLLATRNRKCPICGKPFGNDDVRNVYF